MDYSTPEDTTAAPVYITPQMARLGRYLIFLLENLLSTIMEHIR